MGLAALLAFTAASPWSAVARAQTIDGYGPLKFGMTVPQVRAADRGLEVSKCKSKTYRRACLGKALSFHGDTAVITAFFDKRRGRLARVSFTFFKRKAATGSEACWQLLVRLMRRLRQLYGPDMYRHPNFKSDIYWGDLRGRSVELLNYCQNKDRGIVYIAITNR